jgi:alkaline phosphatase D
MVAPYPSELSRRRAVAALGWLAAVPVLPRRAWATTRLAHDPFLLGVASGSPLHDSVVLWTRLMGPRGPMGGLQPLEGGPVAVGWEVAEDERFGRIVASGQALARPEWGHAVHVEVQGLPPQRWLHYRFVCGDAASPVGRTCTLPEPGARAARLRLAYASCQRWEHGHFAAWRHLAEEQPDAVVFLGDYLYEYPGSARAVRPVDGQWVLTLDDYRRRYALYRSDPALQAAHAACPWWLTWDDHEVQNDYAGEQPGDGGPPVADFAARRAAAYQAWCEHMPVRAATMGRVLAAMAGSAGSAGSGPGEAVRIYQRVDIGRLASLLLLDTRQHRDPQACGPAGRLGSSTFDPEACPAWADPARSLLGAAQERWLDGALARQPGTWTVLGQSTLFGLRDNQPGPGRRLWNDGWDGYPAARRRVTDALQRHAVANPVILGGDVHENWVGHVLADYESPGGKALGAEFCGTSISSRSGGNARTAQRLAENPHFVFGDAERKGYGICEFTPGRLTTTLRMVEDVQRADSGIQTLARFSMEAGSTRIERD